MRDCPNCGHHNREGVVFCENCGASLIGRMPLDTKSLESEEEKSQLAVDASVLTNVKIQGVATFEEGASLRLEIEGSPEPILFKPKSETIFGRRDPATGAMPDVDLTPYAGYRMGVSRRHAAIRFGDDKTLDLWDLGSSNGTFLNGQRLNAHRPYRLHDGDEIRLGQMVIRVFFQTAEKVVAAPVTAPSPLAETKPSQVVAAEPAPAAPPKPEEEQKPDELDIPEAFRLVPGTAPLPGAEMLSQEKVASPAPPTAPPPPEEASSAPAAPQDKAAEAPAPVDRVSPPVETPAEKPDEVSAVAPSGPSNGEKAPEAPATAPAAPPAPAESAADSVSAPQTVSFAPEIGEAPSDAQTKAPAAPPSESPAVSTAANSEDKPASDKTEKPQPENEQKRD